MKRCLFLIMFLCFAAYNVVAFPMEQDARLQDSVSMPTADENGIAPMKFHYGISAGVTFPSSKISANAPLTSVVDYATANLGAFFEEPDYQFNKGFCASLFAQIPLVKGKNFFVELGGQYDHFSYNNEFSSAKSFGDIPFYAIPSNGFAYKMNYGNKESYSMSFVSVPVLFGYEFILNRNVHVDIKTGPVANIMVAAKLDYEGYSNCDVYHCDSYGNIGGYVDRFASKATGEFNMLTAVFDLIQDYGDDFVYEYTNNLTLSSYKKVRPYKMTNFTWRFGAGIGYDHVSLDLFYDLGINNMANSDYWDSRDGTRVPGLLVDGYSFYSLTAIKDYVQKFSSFSACISVRF